MRAICWEGKKSVRVAEVADPEIVNPKDAIVRVTLSAICGSDLHLYNGYIPSMKRGDVLGHEFMGEVVDVGPAVRKIKVGDRVVVSCVIACGSCWHCRRDEWSSCDNTLPAEAALALEKLYGGAGAALYGYSHLFGGYSGGQAELVRVPFADVGCLPVDGHRDEQVLFLSDVLPTGYMAAENCGLAGGETVAVFGCGPVGQFAMMSLRLLGAERIIAVDDVPERLAMARRQAGAEILDESQLPAVETIHEWTAGRGADACIDAVGLEAHGHGIAGAYDAMKHTLRLESDRPTALRQAIMACRKNGTVSVIGVYGGLIDKLPMGAAFGKGVTFRMGQVKAQRYMRPLLQRIEKGEIDPSFIITHRVELDDVPAAYRMFNDKKDGCVKVVARP